MARRTPARTWGNADAALWHTCRIAYELETGAPATGVGVGTLFPLLDGERAYAAGPYLRDNFRADGDGSYQQSTFVAGGGGAFGLALLAATATASAVGNANRRNQAAMAAMHMWRPEAPGQLTVTNYGFYLHDAYGLFRWDWESVQLLQVAGPSVIVMQGQSEHGPVTWRIQSDWAELVFVLWAHTRHRQHPQYLTGQWLPPGWSQWAAEQGWPLHFGAPPSLGG